MITEVLCCLACSKEENTLKELLDNPVLFRNHVEIKAISVPLSTIHYKLQFPYIQDNNHSVIDESFKSKHKNLIVI